MSNALVHRLHAGELTRPLVHLFLHSTSLAVRARSRNRFHSSSAAAPPSHPLTARTHLTRRRAH